MADKSDQYFIQLRSAEKQKIIGQLNGYLKLMFAGYDEELDLIRKFLEDWK